MLVRIAAAVLLSVPLACAAQVYQYKDAQGRTVFSDTPPPGANATKKNVNPPPPSGDSSGSLKEKLQEFQKRRDERLEAEAKRAEERAEKDRMTENCSRARSKLAALQSGQRIVRFNTQGEREFLDDAGRAREMEEAQKSVSEWCK